jgi:hypothetical protein
MRSDEIHRLRAEIERLHGLVHRSGRLHTDDLHQLRAENERLRVLVHALIDSDPNDDAADGVTVLEVWRKEARQALGVESGRKPRYPVLCEECGNYADPPSRLCPGCEAYQAHTHG